MYIYYFERIKLTLLYAVSLTNSFNRCLLSIMSFLAIKKKWATEILDEKESSTDYYCLIRVLYIKNRNIKPEYFSCPTYEKVEYV